MVKISYHINMLILLKQVSTSFNMFFIIFNLIVLCLLKRKPSRHSNLTILSFKEMILKSQNQHQFY
jgi:hypothetical protein